MRRDDDNNRQPGAETAPHLPEASGGLTRRSLLQSVAAAAIGVGALGCATMPKLGEPTGTHPCAMQYCRFHIAPPAGSDAPGTCALPLREEGGRP